MQWSFPAVCSLEISQARESETQILFTGHLTISSTCLPFIQHLLLPYKSGWRSNVWRSSLHSWKSGTIPWRRETVLKKNPIKMMYHILVESNLFCQAPGYLSAHFESFWRYSDLPQIWKLGILKIHFKFIKKKKGVGGKYQPRLFISEFSWMRQNWAPSFLHQWLWFRYLETQLIFSAGSEPSCKTQRKISIYVCLSYPW